MVCFPFFFQAEDGIRDHCVTGVQTCALPISRSVANNSRARGYDAPELFATERGRLGQRAQDSWPDNVLIPPIVCSADSCFTEYISYSLRSLLCYTILIPADLDLIRTQNPG